MNRLRLWLPLLMGLLVVTSGFAQVRTSKSSMGYGAIRVHTSKVDSFYVKDTTATGTTITGVTVKVGRFYSVVASSGNLTPALAAGDSAWYRVTFAADSIGATVDTVFVTFSGGTRAVALTGTGSSNLRFRNAAGTTITALSWTTDTLRPGVAKLDSFQVKNDGTYSINVTGFTNTNSEFVFTAPTFPFAVAANESVWVYTSYTGTEAGRDLDTLVIAHNDTANGSVPLRLNLAGRTSATLRFTLGGVTIDNLDWVAINASNSGTRNGVTTPPVGIDSARVTLATVINNGVDTVRVDSIKFSSIHWENLVPLPYYHRPGAPYNRILRFNYRPKTVSSPEHVDTMYLYTNDPNGSILKLVIKGSSARRVHAVNAANAASLAFGNVSYGTTATLPLRILNQQDIAVTVDSVALDDKDAKYSILSGPNNLSVAAGQQTQFSVQFSAADTTGGPIFRDTVLVYVSGFQAAPLRVPMSGTVVTNIVFLPSATTISVGEFQIQTTKDTTIKIYNRTKDNFTIDGLALTVNASYTIRTNTSSQSLNAGDSVAITLRFAPTASGTHRDTLVISNNIPTTVVATNPYRIALTGTGSTNAVLNPADYVTVDNASGIEGFAIQSPDSNYQESGAFWQNSIGFGGTHRRAPNLSGSVAGASAKWTFKIDETDNYLTYHYMVNSPNAGAAYYVHFRKFGFGGVYDSMRYTLLDNNATGYGGTFFPLAMHNYSGVGPAAMSITIGADERSSSFMRLDAIRLLRSQLTADLEFGRRDINFGPIRVPEEAPQVTVGDEYVRAYRLYNLGSEPLKISKMQFFPTRTPVPWFYFKNYTAGDTLVIPPMTVNSGVESGGYIDVNVAFSPFQEGDARDSLVITSNDPQEPNAYIIMLGLGLNYNFIMNASVGGTEPHFRAPAPPDVTTLPRYFEFGTGAWVSSTASPMFPITGANLSSRVNVGGATTLPQEAYFEFELPDLVYNTISTFGDYILEHSGPVGSPNGHAAGVLRVNHTFGIPQDTTTFSTLLQPIGWIQVGGALKTFKLSPGGKITVTAARPGPTDVTGASNLLRLDLLRVRKVPTGALIGVSVAAGTSVDFGDVNFRAPGGPTGALNKREITLGSRGESQLVISSMRFRNGTKFAVDNAPASFPMYLRAINGNANLTLVFNPDRIAPAFADTLEIISNSVRDSLLLVRVTGNGIGGIFTFDDGGLTVERAATPAFDGLYLGEWDKGAMNSWQIEVNNVADSIGIGKSRRMLPMEYNKTGFFEWYPSLPVAETGGSDSMYVGVYAAIPAGLSGAAPAAKYTVYPGAGAPSKDTVVTQNGRVRGPRGIEEVFLGNYWFIRGGRDTYRDATQGAGAGVFGHVRVSPDTASANFAGSDTLALVADGVVIKELEPPQSGSTGVEDAEIPTEFALDQNFPNPFNPSTTIRFALPMRASVELKVYDLLGREVRVLMSGDQFAPGIHSVTWDGRNSIGQAVATGVYFYRINASGFTESKKMLLLK